MKVRNLWSPGKYFPSPAMIHDMVPSAWVIFWVRNSEQGVREAIDKRKRSLVS
jgi:hypothetical protein